MIKLNEIEIIPRVYIDRTETVIYHANTCNNPYRANEINHPSLAVPLLIIYSWVKVFSYLGIRDTENSAQ